MLSVLIECRGRLLGRKLDEIKALERLVLNLKVSLIRVFITINLHSLLFD